MIACGTNSAIDGAASAPAICRTLPGFVVPTISLFPIAQHHALRFFRALEAASQRSRRHTATDLLTECVSKSVVENGGEVDGATKAT